MSNLEKSKEGNNSHKIFQMLLQEGDRALIFKGPVPDRPNGPKTEKMDSLISKRNSKKWQIQDAGKKFWKKRT